MKLRSIQFDIDVVEIEKIEWRTMIGDLYLCHILLFDGTLIKGVTTQFLPKEGDYWCTLDGVSFPAPKDTINKRFERIPYNA